MEGCAHSIFEIVSNSIDEARDGHGDTINEPDNSLAFEFRGFTVSFAEGKIFVSDEGRAFARYEISHFLQDPGAVVRGIRRECLQRDSMRELSKI